MAKGLIPIENLPQFLSRLKSLLEELGWDKAKLGREANIAPATISRWFTNHRPPTAATLEKILSATRCNTTWLVNGKGDMWKNDIIDPQMHNKTDQTFKKVSSSKNEKVNFQERMRIVIKIVGSGAELARKTKISRRSIVSYMQGKAEPTRKNLLAIANCAGVNFGWLGAGEGDSPEIVKESLKNSFEGQLHEVVGLMKTHASPALLSAFKEKLLSAKQFESL